MQVLNAEELAKPPLTLPKRLPKGFKVLSNEYYSALNQLLFSGLG
jgi:hypothetical protein